MFRADRIGSPYIHQGTSNNSVAAFTLNVLGLTSNSWNGNVISSAPLLDFGRLALTWNGTPVSLPAGNRCSFLMPFTITEPLNGDTVGVEMAAAITLNCNDNLALRPIFGKLVAAGGATLAQVTFADFPTRFGKTQTAPVGATGASSHRFYQYKDELIVQYPSGSVGGPYAHGVEVLNQSGAASSIAALQMSASVRQLNDQQTIGYRDTRK